LLQTIRKNQHSLHPALYELILLFSSCLYLPDSIFFTLWIVELRSCVWDIGLYPFGRKNDTSQRLSRFERTINELASSRVSSFAMVLTPYWNCSFPFWYLLWWICLSVERYFKLSWILHRIILSNRAHIVKLHEKVHIKSMETPHQYLLVHLISFFATFSLNSFYTSLIHWICFCSCQRKAQCTTRKGRAF
jgi:hypothetical protein